jgi:hypothetical protein
MPRGARRLERTLVWFYVCAGVGALLGNACLETRRSLGEDCLKDDDCQSRICSQLRCAAAPPTTDAPSELPLDAAHEGAAESSVVVPVDSDAAHD